jgi:hypothetical protein
MKIVLPPAARREAGAARRGRARRGGGGGLRALAGPGHRLGGPHVRAHPGPRALSRYRFPP